MEAILTIQLNSDIPRHRQSNFSLLWDIFLIGAKRGTKTEEGANRGQKLKML